MVWRVHILAKWSLVLLLCAGCRDDPPQQPNPAPMLAVDVDERHVASVRADRMMTVPNLVFVLQHDPSYPTQMGLTLKTAQPGPDGLRLLFYKFEKASSLAKLAKSEIYLLGGRHYDRNGPGIFAATAAYQPKFASMKITKHTEDEIHGAVTGEFYKFNPLQPAVRPDVVDVEMTFIAALVVK
ncbi:MAG: hypothetical protein MI923_16665 [Phycisphaerales bacterium]|nr:hypothetical protein [Phycisphaerales bacterium]